MLRPITDRPEHCYGFSHLSKYDYVGVVICQILQSVISIIIRCSLIVKSKFRIFIQKSVEK